MQTFDVLCHSKVIKDLMAVFRPFKLVWIELRVFRNVVSQRVSFEPQTGSDVMFPDMIVRSA